MPAPNKRFGASGGWLVRHFVSYSTFRSRPNHINTPACVKPQGVIGKRVTAQGTETCDLKRKVQFDNVVEN